VPPQQQGGVHRDHGVLEGPLAGAVDQGPGRRRGAQRTHGDDLLGAQRGVADPVPAPLPPPAGIGQPDHRPGEGRPDGHPPEPGRRPVADHGAGAAEGQQRGQALHLVSPALPFVLGELVGRDEDAPAEADPPTGAAQAADLLGWMAGPHGVRGGEEAQPAVGLGTESGVHGRRLRCSGTAVSRRR
jgi:hypothetical protein